MKSIPRLKFAQLPTPIEPMPRLSAALNGPSLFIKRDDQTGLASGGNKTRKLEYLVAEAQMNGAQTLITAGAVQSNHCRQTAAAAAHFGFKCILVLVGEKPEVATGNYLLDQLFGAEIVWVKRENRTQSLQETFQLAWEQGRRPYLIPYGGSNATGAAAYAFAIQELLRQTGSNELPQPPDWIVFPSSSGGTQAGMVLGAHLFDFPAKILGISVDEPETTLKNLVADLANKTADLLGERTNFTGQHILVNADYTGGGYGVLGEIEKEAVQLFARTEGILLDPVYTGRAAAGLIDLIRKGYFSASQIVLFWHTGGLPALFAHQYQGIVT